MLQVREVLDDIDYRPIEGEGFNPNDLLDQCVFKICHAKTTLDAVEATKHTAFLLDNEKKFFKMLRKKGAEFASLPRHESTIDLMDNSAAEYTYTVTNGIQGGEIVNVIHAEGLLHDEIFAMRKTSKGYQCYEDGQCFLRKSREGGRKMDLVDKDGNLFCTIDEEGRLTNNSTNFGTYVDEYVAFYSIEDLEEANGDKPGPRTMLANFEWYPVDESKPTGLSRVKIYNPEDISLEFVFLVSAAPFLILLEK